MEKTITYFQKSFRQIRLSGAVLVGLFLLLGTTASAQYNSPTHYFGCEWTYTSYGSIDDVEIEDASGTSLYSKAADGCNKQGQNTHYNLISAADNFTLTAGADYTITVSTSNTNGSGAANYVGVWFDFNGDYDFADPGEFVTPNNWSVGGGGNSYTFTVPCNVKEGSTYRMRIRSNAYFYSMNAGHWDDAGTAMYYGETEDYGCSFDKPTNYNVSFYVPDTAYIGTIVKSTNSSAAAATNRWDINDDGTVEYTTRDFEHIFNAVGTYDIELMIANCAGSDSTVNDITIVAPTAAPVADFVSDRNVVELYDIFTLIDLSSNGATYWNWFLHNGTDTVDALDMIQLQGGDPYTNANPIVWTGPNPVGFPKTQPDRGLWSVCLQASNSIGPSSVVCKTDYIEVTKTSFNMGPETSLPANIISAGSGTLYDKGGPNNNYTVPEANLEALIAPCGAQSVTLEFVQFKLNANANLKVYDGVNALGTPMHTGTGFTAGNAPTGPLTASTGTMYLLWNSSTGATDSGFIANWTSVEGSGATIVADFDLPADTIYNAVVVDFINTSQNAEGNVKFEWEIDGTTVGFGRDLLDQFFLTNGGHTVKLTIYNCDGTTYTVTKNIWVAHPGTPTELDFVADNQRPRSGEDVTFTATSDKANAWEYTVFPNTGVTQNPGSIFNPDQSFNFAAPGKYTVQCKAYNLVDSTFSENTVIKANYIIVVEHCNPVVSVTTSTDVSISSVKLTSDASGATLINNPSQVGVDYENFSDDIVAVNYGGTYNFEISRNTNVNPMSRKIWIDWNVDGDFDDAGEMVASEATGTSSTWMGSFTVPDAADAFEANTIMRVGVSYGTDANSPCGPNRIGEFEDYGIRVENDGDKPVITLIGSDTVYVEQGSVYADLGATAWDPSQGDISSEIVTTSNVDESLTGIYSVEYCVEDASGNVAECVYRTVYVVVDQTPPVITLNGSASETVEVGSSWTDAGATAVDNKDGNLDAAIVVTGSVDVNVLGTYTVTYYVQDAQSNSSTVIRTVNVVDTQVPVITNASAYPDGTDPNIWIVDVQLQNVFVDVTSFDDNYNSIGDGLVVTASPGIGFEASVDTRFKGTTTVTYVATDESGNETVQVIKYVVEDYIPPMIDLHTLDTVWHEVNTTYTPVNATTSDNLYDNTQISLSMISNVNPYKLGTYYDTYTATDASGNVSTRERTVKVVDTEAPTITGKNGPIVRVGLYSEFAAIERLVFADNYDDPSDIKANHVLTYTDINTYKEGLYTATFVTTDNSGNESSPFTLYVVVSRDELQVGVDELDLDNLMSVAPNPTTGLVNINVDLPENEEISVNVYNAMGQKVTEVVNGNITHGTYQVDLSGNANGFYYVKMAVRGTVITKKVMLNQ